MITTKTRVYTIRTKGTRKLLNITADKIELDEESNTLYFYILDTLIAIIPQDAIELEISSSTERTTIFFEKDEV